MRRIGMFLLGVALGALVGAVLAALLTPASGDRMRREAQAYYEQLLAEARQAAEARRRQLELELRDMTGGADSPA